MVHNKCEYRIWSTISEKELKPTSKQEISRPDEEQIRIWGGFPGFVGCAGQIARQQTNRTSHVLTVNTKNIEPKQMRRGENIRMRIWTYRRGPRTGRRREGPAKDRCREAKTSSALLRRRSPLSCSKQWTHYSHRSALEVIHTAIGVCQIESVSQWNQSESQKGRLYTPEVCITSSNPIEGELRHAEVFSQ